MKRFPEKIKFLNVCLFTSALIGVSCQKTEDFEDLDLLIGKRWELVTVKTGDKLSHEDCHLDDVLFFESTSEFDYITGAILCDESENLRKATTWKLRKNYSEIRLDYEIQFGGKSTMGHEYWELVELTENRLVLKDDGGQEVIIRVYEQ